MLKLRNDVWDISDDEINEYRTTLLNLQARKILNLSGLTNTDLKEKYGVANLSALSEYDENYITLVNIIARCGARLIEIGNCSLAAVIIYFRKRIRSSLSALGFGASFGLFFSNALSRPLAILFLHS